MLPDNARGRYTFSGWLAWCSCWKQTIGLSLILALPTASLAQPPNAPPSPSPATENQKLDTSKLPMAKRSIAKEPTGEMAPLPPKSDKPSSTGLVTPMAARDVARPPQDPAPPAPKEEAKIEVQDAIIVGRAVPAQRLAPALMLGRGAQPDPTKKEMERLLNQQLQFIHRCLILTDEQKDSLRRFDLEWALANVKLRSGKAVNGVVVGNSDSVSRKSRQTQLENVLEKELTQVLTPDQMKTYLDERELRRKFQKEASVDGIMILLDNHLFLREDQYQSIRESLLKNYRGEHYLEAYLYDSQNIPPIPDSSVIKFLDESQKTVYQTLNKIDYGTDTPFAEDDF